MTDKTLGDDLSGSSIACHTQDEIAAVVGVSQHTVANRIESFTNLGSASKSGKTHVFYQEDESGS